MNVFQPLHQLLAGETGPESQSIYVLTGGNLQKWSVSTSHERVNPSAYPLLFALLFNYGIVVACSRNLCLLISVMRLGLITNVPSNIPCSLQKISCVQHFTGAHLYLERHVWNVCKNIFPRKIHVRSSILVCDHLTTCLRVHMSAA